MSYKELITKLQILPPIPVPVAVYPTKEGTYAGSRYYSAAQTQLQVNELVRYLSTLSEWRSIVLQSRADTYLQKLSNDICQGLNTNYQKTKAIHRWVFDHINYMQTSSLIPPKKLVETRAGDCKSFTTLISTLLGIQAIPSWFKLVQLYDISPRHIYTFALNSWTPVDGTGYFCFSEVQRVIGYLLFEVDKTTTSPPQPPPSPIGAEEYPPVLTIEEIAGLLPLIGIGALVALGIKEIREV